MLAACCAELLQPIAAVGNRPMWGVHSVLLGRVQKMCFVIEVPPRNGILLMCRLLASMFCVAFGLVRKWRDTIFVVRKGDY